MTKKHQGVYALTGGIGSGKSTVAGLFLDAGAQVIDADKIAYEVVARGSLGLQEVISRFGTEFLTSNGDLDRVKMGQRVFGDEEARKALESIVHPRVAKRAVEAFRLAREARPQSLIVYDIPLLFETSQEKDFEGVILVFVDEETQKNRLLARDGLSQEDIQRRLDAQIPLREKQARADFVIDNTGSLEETKQEVRKLFEDLMERS